MSENVLPPPPEPSLTHQKNGALRVVWGAPAIAQAIGREVRAVYHMLENGTLPGAKKVGGVWCFCPDIFYASLAD